jgi:hypothetical protein
MPIPDRIPPFQFRPQQRQRIQTQYNPELLNIYVSMYNQTIRRMDLLYKTLDEIRDSIDIISGVQPRLYEDNSRESIPIHTPTPIPNIIPNVLPLLQPRHQNQHQPLSNEYISLLNLLNESMTVDRTFFDRVQVSPSAVQISRALRVVLFSSIENPSNTNCPITLEPFEDDSIVSQIRHCGHVFNTANIRSWFRNNVGCPVCRYDIRDYHLETGHESIGELYDDEEVNDEDVQNNSEPPTYANVAAYSNNGQDETLNTFSNMTGRILSDLLNIPSSSGNPIEFDNTRYYIDASNSQIIFEGFLRNSFR